MNLAAHPKSSMWRGVSMACRGAPAPWGGPLQLYGSLRQKTLACFLTPFLSPSLRICCWACKWCNLVFTRYFYFLKVKIQSEGQMKYSFSIAPNWLGELQSKNLTEEDGRGGVCVESIDMTSRILLQFSFLIVFQKYRRERKRVSNCPKMVEFVLRLNKPLVQVALNSRSVSALYYQTTSDFCSFSFVFLFRGLFLKEDYVTGPLPFQEK